MAKTDVRILAKKFNVPVAQKRDSQGVCFLGSVSIDEFLRSEFGEAPGHALDEAGNVVGTHDGVLLHTIGARVALKGAAPGPWFVRAKDVEKNEIVVGIGKSSPAPRGSGSISFSSANWIGEAARATEIQYRYRGPVLSGHIEHDRFVSDVPIPEIPAPGQSIVFYRGDELIGGGIIV